MPAVWIPLVVGAVHGAAMRLAASGRAAAMQAVSPALLSPLGIVFALIVGLEQVLPRT